MFVDSGYYGMDPLNMIQISGVAGIFACDLCGKIFHNKNNRNRHMIIHTRQRRHRCAFCNYASLRPGNLRRHLITHQKQVLQLHPPATQRNPIVQDANAARTHNVGVPRPEYVVSQMDTRGAPSTEQSNETNPQMAKTSGQRPEQDPHSHQNR